MGGGWVGVGREGGHNGVEIAHSGTENGNQREKHRLFRPKT